MPRFRHDLNILNKPSKSLGLQGTEQELRRTTEKPRSTHTTCDHTNVPHTARKSLAVRG